MNHYRRASLRFQNLADRKPFIAAVVFVAVLAIPTGVVCKLLIGFPTSWASVPFTSLYVSIVPLVAVYWGFRIGAKRRIAAARPNVATRDQVKP